MRHHRLGLHAVLQQKTLPTRTLALEPPCGWNGKRGQQFLKPYQWLKWKNTQQIAGVIAHAFNWGERTLQVGSRRYQVDGFNDTTQTVYEFHGCLWHRCPECFRGSMDKTTRLHPDRTKRELFEATMQKHQQLQTHGYRVMACWECQWDRLRQRPDVAAFVNSRPFPVPSLNPRDAFFGGRTNAVRLWHEIDEDRGEEIRYVDVTSLYPTVNKYDEYPIGHPTIVIARYFGIADCTVLPSEGLFHPVRPYRCKGKSPFPSAERAWKKNCPIEGPNLVVRTHRRSTEYPRHVVQPRTSQSHQERVPCSPHSRSVRLSPRSASQRVVQRVRQHVAQM